MTAVLYVSPLNPTREFAMKVTKTHVAIAKKIILDQAQAYRVLRRKTATKVRAIEKKANAIRRGYPNLVKITELNQLTAVLLGLRSDLDYARRGVELNAECFNAEIKLLGERYHGDLIRINDLLANRDVNPKQAKKAIPT